MPNPLKTFTKDPAAVLDYTVDWDADDWLGSDTITGTPVWTLPSGITLASQSNTTTTATAWLSGGTANTDYDVACKITTTAGRTDERTIRIQVRNR
jgi:hypothetical protein